MSKPQPNKQKGGRAYETDPQPADPQTAEVSEAVASPKTETTTINSSFTKKDNMKTIYFNVQAKGGTGKSFLTVLQALKEEKNESALFVDLDSSTQSSMKNLKFLSGKTPARLFSANLLDDRKKIVRDKLLSTIESLLALKDGYEKFYLDFGAPESEQFPALISHDLKPKDLKAFEEHLGVKFVFNIIVAGGTAYVSCTEYMSNLATLLDGMFEVNILANKFTFYNFSHLLEELKENAEKNTKLISSFKPFGDIDVSSDTGKAIMVNIEQGRGYDDLSFSAKLKINNELENV